MIPRRGLMSGPSTLSTNQTCPQWQTRQEKRAAAERPVATLEPSQLSRRGFAAETLNARSDGPCLRSKADGVRQGIAGSWPVDGALRSDCAAGRSCGRARPSCRSEANPAMGKDPKTNLGVVARPVPNASAPLPVQRSLHVTRERRPQRVAVDTLGGRHGATGIALHLERRGDIAVAVEGTAVEQQTGAGSGRIPGEMRACRLEPFSWLSWSGARAVLAAIARPHQRHMSRLSGSDLAVVGLLFGPPSARGFLAASVRRSGGAGASLGVGVRGAMLVEPSAEEPRRPWIAGQRADAREAQRRCRGLISGRPSRWRR